MLRAARERSSVNVFHRASSIKVDLFVMGGSSLDAEQMERRQRVQVRMNPVRHLYAYTPEDILLQKLLGSARGTKCPTGSGVTSSASSWCKAMHWTEPTFGIGQRVWACWIWWTGPSWHSVGLRSEVLPIALVATSTHSGALHAVELPRGIARELGPFWAALNEVPERLR